MRAESFADHYSQAKLFWDSQTPVEQDHIAAAFEKGGALVDLIGPSVGLEVGGRPMDHAVAAALLEAAGLAEAVGSDGVLAVEDSSVKAFWEACGGIRVWDRDVRP
ncbi:catalase-related domain-containing protein [Propioniciclava sp. MC1595]|uniref:catalase-related domain-containing protein n=1 Tax=Propioniciclava sp. MC1595 TaxID=2760308 RepID=UPI0035CCF8AF